MHKQLFHQLFSRLYSHVYANCTVFPAWDGKLQAMIKLIKPMANVRLALLAQAVAFDQAM